MTKRAEIEIQEVTEDYQEFEVCIYSRNCPRQTTKKYY